MKLIEDLGMQFATENSKNRTHFGLFECPLCGKHIRCAMYNVRSGNSTMCFSCCHAIKTTARRDKAASEFVEKATITHGDRYDYSLVEYTRGDQYVNILCKIHGVFKQTPGNHRNGAGCPECAKENNSIAARMNCKYPTMLYYVYLPEHNLWKIGCTRRSLSERFGKILVEPIDTVTFSFGGDAYRLEHIMLSILKGLRYKGPPIMYKGNTEVLTQPINFIEVLGDAYVKMLQEPLKIPESPQE